MKVLMDKSRRRVFLINPKFQLTFLGYMVATALATCVIYYGANFYFISEFKQMGLDLGLPVDHVYFQFIQQQQYKLNFIFSVTTAIAFTAICLLGLFLSHRVAGPIYRLHQHMILVARGKTTSEVKFRDRDFFPELAQSYNEQLRVARGGKPSGIAAKSEAA